MLVKLTRVVDVYGFDVFQIWNDPAMILFPALTPLRCVSQPNQANYLIGHDVSVNDVIFFAHTQNYIHTYWRIHSVVWDW
jgi:hypothetical protein